MNATNSLQVKAVLEEGTMFSDSQKVGLKYVLDYSPDRMLAPAYKAMGKTPKDVTYGGWEARQIQGHMLGHYLSALSGFYYQTGSTEAKQKLDYTVKCIKELQRDDGYFGGIPSTPFDKILRLTDFRSLTGGYRGIQFTKFMRDFSTHTFTAETRTLSK